MKANVRIANHSTLRLTLTSTILFFALALASSSVLGSNELQQATGGARSAAVRPQRSRVQTQPNSVGSAVEVATTNSTSNANNRTTRTAEIFQNGDGYNLVVTNTCERESMKVNIKTSRGFYGVIHTRNHRHKSICSVDGNGELEYNLDISHVLNPLDPNHCGVVRVRRESPDDKDVLSVVVAVRFNRNIELLDDKFFLLNCTNRCRKPDCSTPSAKLVDSDDANSPSVIAGEREGQAGGVNRQPEECTIYKFPWAITLLWCLGILLLAMIISHCIMCSSLVCRCVRHEVEEREPSLYEQDSEDATRGKQINYDNNDIYKTSNNYSPYSRTDRMYNKKTSR